MAVLLEAEGNSCGTERTDLLLPGGAVIRTGTGEARRIEIVDEHV